MSAPHWHHRWNVLALTLFSQALSLGILIYSFAFCVVPWLDEFKTTRVELMLIITVSSIISGLASPFVGVALDRFQARGLFITGILLLSLGLALTSQAANPREILVIYSVTLPIGVALIGQLGSQALVTRWFTHNRGFAIGVSATGISIGAIVMPPLTTALIAAVGWRHAFLVLAFGVLVLLLPLAWWVLAREPDTSASAAPARSAVPSAWTTAQLLRNRDFWVISGCLASLIFAGLPVMHSIGAYAHDFGIPQSRAAFAASIGALALMGGKLGFGSLIDWMEHPRCYRIAGSLMIMGVTLVSLAPGFWSLFLGYGLMMLGFGSTLPFISGMISARFGTSAFGQVAGLVTFIMSSGSLAIVAAGFIREISGSYGVAFMAPLLPLVVSLFAVQWLSNVQKAA